MKTCCRQYFSTEIINIFVHHIQRKETKPEISYFHIIYPLGVFIAPCLNGNTFMRMNSAFRCLFQCVFLFPNVFYQFFDTFRIHRVNDEATILSINIGMAGLDQCLGNKVCITCPQSRAGCAFYAACNCLPDK